MSYSGQFADAIGLSQSTVTTLDGLGIPAVLLLPSALLFYVRALTDTEPLKLKPRHIWHLIPPIIGLIICILILPLPIEGRMRVLTGSDGSDLTSIGEAIPGFLTAIFYLSFPLIYISYLTVILRRLITYRQKLKNLYASTVGKELNWIGWAAVLFGIDWILTLLSIYTDYADFYDGPVGEAFNLVLFWGIALWALRPLHIETDLNSIAHNPENTPQAHKYGRAALSREARVQIAQKIRKAMRVDKLYLDPNFSLHRLAAAVKEQPNNVSQTLNTEIGETFFDFINGYRIRASLAEILDNEKTILTIAYSVGFNSQSSFYKAFKTETGLTPTAYRKAVTETPKNRKTSMVQP